MAVQQKFDNPMKAAVSVSSVCRLLKMSRSQFYFHVRRGTFHAPLRLPSNQRPYFTASMVEDIIKARETGIGVNGEFVIFYERQPNGTKNVDKTPKADHSALVEGLSLLGLTNVTTEQVEAAIAVCSPDGTTGQDEASLLRTVFRHLKRAGSA
jgi:predicted DNA-binding transcriptional regulator AlpA